MDLGKNIMLGDTGICGGWIKTGRGLDEAYWKTHYPVAIECAANIQDELISILIRQTKRM